MKGSVFHYFKAMVIERNKDAAPDPAPAPEAAQRKTVIIVLNSVIGLLIAAVVYLFAAYFLPVSQQKEKEILENQQVRIIQIDVRNGCGITGCAARITDLLRERGFDVVEVKNYVSFDIPYTMIIDRVNDHGSARRVAFALGVDHRNIVKQFNTDYLVDVTVVVGQDYNTLKPSPINIPKE